MQNRDWLHFAERSGPEGREWVEEYHRHLNKADLGDLALQRMREGRHEEGGELLRQLIDQVEEVHTGSPSVRAVLDRYRHGIEGYYFYCRKEFEAAERSMDRAHDAVARALNKANWLMLLAVHCQEFRLHQARIARNQHRWAKMQAYIAQARAMMSDLLPLCETEEGKTIWWSNFQPFFAALEPFTPEEARIVNNLLDPEERERLFDQFVRGMLRSSSNGVKTLPPR